MQAVYLSRNASEGHVQVAYSSGNAPEEHAQTAYWSRNAPEMNKRRSETPMPRTDVRTDT